MRKILLGLFIISISFVSCESSETKKFKDANKNAVNKHVQEVFIKREDGILNFKGIYDKNNKLISAEIPKELDNGKLLFKYDDFGNLNTIKGFGNIFDVSKILTYGDKAYKIGKILEYDSNKNPVKLEISTEFDYSIIYDDTDSNEVNKEDKDTEYEILHITYDDKPFFAFHTLKAAGIMDVLEKLKLNLAEPNKPAKIKSAKEIIPVKNITKVEFFEKSDSKKNLRLEIKFAYTYDNDNYPSNIEIELIHYDIENNTFDRETFDVTLIYRQ